MIITDRPAQPNVLALSTLEKSIYTHGNNSNTIDQVHPPSRVPDAPNAVVDSELHREWVPQRRILGRCTLPWLCFCAIHSCPILSLLLDWTGVCEAVDARPDRSIHLKSFGWRSTTKCAIRLDNRDRHRGAMNRAAHRRHRPQRPFEAASLTSAVIPAPPEGSPTAIPSHHSRSQRVAHSQTMDPVAPPQVHE